MEVEEGINTSPAISTTATSSPNNNNNNNNNNNSNNNNNNNNASTTITSTTVKSPAKRSNKPLMERRRRARINNCLLQLKCLLLQDMKREENSHVSKFEKAEILEMTVQKLKKIRDWIQVQEAEVSSKEHGFREHPRYKAGFNDCMNEVVCYLSKKDCGNNEFQSRVMNHLNHCYNTGSLVSAEAATKPGSVSSSDDMETNFGIRTYDHHPNQSQIQTQTTTTTNATLALSVPQPEEHLSGSKCTKQFPVNYNKQYDCSSSLQQTTNLNLNNNANRKLTPDLSPCVVANGEMAAIPVATSTPKGLFQPVNIITDSIPKLVNSQHAAIQLDTNISEPNCKTYVRVITPNSTVNGQEVMKTLPSRTSGSSMTQVTASTNTVNMDEMSQRHAGQIITGIDYYNNKNNIIFSNSNGGAPIAFLVTTPLPVKAIPLYTSLDKTQETCVGVLSPHATNIKSNTTISAEVPPRCQSLNMADSSVLKTDVTNRGHSYRMSNRGDSENKFVTSSNVWRPWNAVE